MKSLYKLTFFVPQNSKEEVKSAVFTAGAGKIGNYQQCCFEVEGTGQFCPQAGANPTLGELNKLEKVQEVRIEMVCSESFLKDVIKALHSSHPYETPAYDVIKMENY